MALIVRSLNRNHCIIKIITKPVNFSLANGFPIRVLASGICYQSSQSVYYKPLYKGRQLDEVIGLVRNYSSGTKDNKQSDVQASATSKHGEDTSKTFTQGGEAFKTTKHPGADAPQASLFQRFKTMYRNYWYVLVPVHMGTSAIWLGCFYYAVRSGVDVLALMEWIGLSDKLLEPLRESSAGYVALTLALYKLATPIRYTVTLGGTTLAINKLTAMGWIKPVPSTERLKEMIQEKKDNLQDRFNESKEHYKTQMTEKRSQMMDEMRRYKTEMRNFKNKVKKM